MSCSSCVAHIENSVAKLTGVTKVQVALMTNTAEVCVIPSVTTPEAVQELICSLGFDATLIKTGLLGIYLRISGVGQREAATALRSVGGVMSVDVVSTASSQEPTGFNENLLHHNTFVMHVEYTVATARM